MFMKFFQLTNSVVSKLWILKIAFHVWQTLFARNHRLGSRQTRDKFAAPANINFIASKYVIFEKRPKKASETNILSLNPIF